MCVFWLFLRVRLTKCMLHVHVFKLHVHVFLSVPDVTSSDVDLMLLLAVETGT